MITSYEKFTSEDAATQRGIYLKEAWGWGYGGTYRVYLDSSDGMYVMEFTRYTSCD